MLGTELYDVPEHKILEGFELRRRKLFRAFAESGLGPFFWHVLVIERALISLRRFQAGRVGRNGFLENCLDRLQVIVERLNLAPSPLGENVRAVERISESAGVGAADQ